MDKGLYAKFDHHDKMTPIIIPRFEHPISRKMIDEDALKVLYRLHRHGFISYLVGGSVRDLLLGKVPKDFDVATDAHPHEINVLFKNSRTIGRRFRLVQVFFEHRKVIDVSTFRSHSEFEEKKADGGDTPRDHFGTPEEDALRRDLTINGMFYNISDLSIIDYVGGIADIKRRIVRTIGNPDERFLQDPVRMIRVIRHAARTEFSIEEQTYEAIFRHREEIRKCSPSRIRDEFLRDLKEGAAEASLKLMLQTGLLFSLFPDLQRAFGDRNPFKEREIKFFLALLRLADQLNKIGKPVQESILLALFLSPFIRVITPEHPFLEEWKRLGYLTQTIRWAIQQILNPFSFPKGTKEMAAQILIAQGNLKKSLRRGGIPKKLKMKKYFQEAALFFGIEAQARGEGVPRLLRHAVPSDLLPWWPKGFKRRQQRFSHSIPFTT